MSPFVGADVRFLQKLPSPFSAVFPRFWCQLYQGRGSYREDWIRAIAISCAQYKASLQLLPYLSTEHKAPADYPVTRLETSFLESRDANPLKLAAQPAAIDYHLDDYLLKHEYRQ